VSFGAFFSHLDPLLLAVCDDDFCVLLCVAVCVTDSSVCGCFRGFFFFWVEFLFLFFLRLVVGKRWVAV
jgi:hypothetical protein